MQTTKDVDFVITLKKPGQKWFCLLILRALQCQSQIHTYLHVLPIRYDQRNIIQMILFLLNVETQIKPKNTIQEQI